MKITIKPTQEMFAVRLRDGRTLPTRIWHGKTDKGTSIDAYVFSIVPAAADGPGKLAHEIPSFMKQTKAAVDINTDADAYWHEGKTRSLCLHLFGREPTREEEVLVKALLDANGL